MSIGRRQLSIAYQAIALLALAATWNQNLRFFGSAPAGQSMLGGFASFWQHTFVNAASASITLDIFLLGLAVIVWMVVEARRLEIPGVWIYVVLGFLVAISVTVPLFLAARERRLGADEAAPREPASVAPSLTMGDVVGLAATGVPIVGLSLWSLLG